MTDQDYIKAAVELADGWTYHDGDCSHEETERWFIDCKLPQVWLDALAAQLVRQVDVLNVTNLEIYNDGVYIGTDHDDNIIISDSDRTMNTIKAIVDSGKLK